MAQYAWGRNRPPPFYIDDFGAPKPDEPAHDVPHRHDFFEVFWVTHGEGEVRCGSENYPVTPGSLFLVSLGQAHVCAPKGSFGGEMLDFTPAFLHLSPENPVLLTRLLSVLGGRLPPVLNPGEADRGRIDRVFRQMREADAVQAPGRGDIIRAYITILLNLVLQIVPQYRLAPSGSVEAESLVTRFYSALEERFPRLQEMEAYAALLRVSPGSLNATLRHHTGQSGCEIIQNRLLLEAKRMLALSKLTVSEIAYELGFQDPSYFGRFFRKSTGQSPGTYREASRREALAG